MNNIIKFEDLTDGRRIEHLQLINGHLKWVEGTVCVSNGLFFEKRVILDNGDIEPLMPHRMHNVRIK